MNIYTVKERTELNYTVGKAVKLAEYRLKTTKICVNVIQGMNLSDKITLEQMNQLADQIVEDTDYYN